MPTKPYKPDWNLLCLLVFFPFAPNITEHVCVQGETRFATFLKCLQCGGKRKREALVM